LSERLRDIEARIQGLERKREEKSVAQAIDLQKKRRPERECSARRAEDLRPQILLFFYGIDSNLPAYSEVARAGGKEVLDQIEFRARALCEMIEQLRMEENLEELERERDKVKADLAKKPAKIEPKAKAEGKRVAPPELNDTEQYTIEALSEDTLTGERLAKKAGYPYNSNFKSTLSGLRKRGILGNKSPGYFLESQYHFLLDKSDQGQDNRQD